MVPINSIWKELDLEENNLEVILSIRKGPGFINLHGSRKCQLDRFSVLPFRNKRYPSLYVNGEVQTEELKTFHYELLGNQNTEPNHN